MNQTYEQDLLKTPKLVDMQEQVYKVLIQCHRRSHHQLQNELDDKCVNINIDIENQNDKLMLQGMLQHMQGGDARGE